MIRCRKDGVGIAMFEYVREDLKHGLNRNMRGAQGPAAVFEVLFHPGTQAIMVYRFGNWAWRMKIPGLRHLLLAIYFPFKYFFLIVTGVNIPTSARIGPGLVIHTASGVYLPPCRIGRNAYFQHGNVVFYGCKGIGDDVYFGPGAKVIKPIRIGDRVKIGANAVVTKDIPDDCTVAGIPARIISGPGVDLDENSEERPARPAARNS